MSVGSAAQSVQPTVDHIHNWNTILLDRHNQRRAGNGLPRLELDPVLRGLAVTQARVIAKRRMGAPCERADHYDDAGRDAATRFVGAAKRIGVVLENLGDVSGVGRDSADVVMNGWMNSPGHCANILSRQVTKVGFGVWFVGDGANRTIYVCAIFMGEVG
jgi:uncharacterized protein YkwD